MTERIVRTADGSALTLSDAEVAGWGGEAVVYAPAALPALAAKVYHAPSPEHATRLEAMLASPPEAPGAFTWPVEPLRHPEGAVAGYLMPRLDPALVSLAELFTSRTRRAHAPNATHGTLLRAGRSLAAALAALHARGHTAGDLDEADVLASPDGAVTLRDTDSFQIRDPATGALFRARPVRADLAPPELQGVRPDAVGPEHDGFGLAVLLFQLLMEGTHPFAGERPDAGSLPERIRDGDFPYMPGARCRPAPQSPPLELLDPEVRALFVRCFAEGHARPAARPSAGEWAGALARAESRLVSCAANPRHEHGGHLAACPWCERARLRAGRDPFPPSDDTVLPGLAPLPAPSSPRGPRRTAPVTAKVRHRGASGAPLPAYEPARPAAYSPPVPAYPSAAPPPRPDHPPAARPVAPEPGPSSAAARPESAQAAVNPFAGLTLLLAVAGAVPPLRTIAWGLALVSALAALAFASNRGGAGRPQIGGAMGVMLLTLAWGSAAPGRPRAGEPPTPVAVAPPAAREEPAAEPPRPAAPPEERPRATPRSTDRPKAAPRASGRAEAAPERSRATPRPERTTTLRTTERTRATPRATERPRTTPRTTDRQKDTPRAPERPRTSERPKAAPRLDRTAPRPRPPAPPPEPASPSADELAPIRADLAVARALKNQGAYYDAGIRLRTTQADAARLAARYPRSRAATDLQATVRTLASDNRRACQAEAAVFRARGEATSPCP